MKVFDEEINLLDYLRVLKKRKKLIYNLILISVILTAIVSLFMTKIYKAEATLMPVDASKNVSSSLLMSAAESVPFLNLGSSFGGSSLTKLSTILESRSVAEEVIRALNLDRVFFKGSWDNVKKKWKKNPPPSMEKSVSILQSMVKIYPDSKKNLLTVSVENSDPKFAARIVDEFLSSLQKFLNENTMTLAKKNRINLEKQLLKTREDLVKSEEFLALFQQNKQIIELDKQTESALKTSAELKAKLIAKKVELGVIKKFSTDSNPDVMSLKDEIAELEKQVEMIELGENGGKPLTGGDRVFRSLKETPDIGLDFLRLKREVLVQEKVYELLSQQYELAKIEEAKDSIDFTVIDKAVPPEKRIKPKRIQNVLLAGIISLLIGIFLAFSLEYWENVKDKE